ncbi:MAG: hypothetical protein SFY68_04005 [Candidatus Sumerlaeia bacterium]|nr:hypothetical protein [Candidatus Sumerlaeia bacterium]
MDVLEDVRESLTGTQPLIPLKVQAHQAATTRGAFLDLQAGNSVEGFHRLARRGYNTVLLPLMKNGDLAAKVVQINRSVGRTGLSGSLPTLLREIAGDPGSSLWISMDPLSAGDSAEGSLSPFARSHADWLLRNSQGRMYPVGRRGFSPLFSWVNMEYRRYLGDLLVKLAENYQFTGVVLDFRAYPIRSSDPERWYCCSYSSQIRIQEELGLRFDSLLAHGTRTEIHRWQRWVTQELTAFIQYLKSRVRVARYDVFWKVLVNYTNPHDLEESPWIKWIKDGLVEEVLVSWKPESTTLSTLIQQTDLAVGEHRLILPVLRNEADLQEYWGGIRDSCVTGYVVEQPDDESIKLLPTFPSYWSFRKALEDYPHETSIALAKFLAEQFGREHRLGRLFGRIATGLESFTPVPDQVALVLKKIKQLEKRYGAISATLKKDEVHLKREMELMMRLLPTVRMKPEVY